MSVMRITQHPKDPDWLLLRFPPELNRVIHTFGPAQQAFDLGGYVAPVKDLPALQRWAVFHGITLLNEVRSTSGEPSSPIMCGNVVEYLTKDGREAKRTDPGAIPIHCWTPYSASNPPKFCPDCGQSARIVAVKDDDSAVIPLTACSKCGHRTNGRFKFCARCGARMVYPERQGLRVIPRPMLDDPVPLGGEVVDLVTRLGAPEGLFDEDDES